MGFIRIGFLPITVWDILDIAIVGYLIYQIYRLLRGSIAFNIFVAIILIYVVSSVVTFLQMGLLSRILGQFADLSVLALLIIFQPEVRRFLVVLGTGTLRQRFDFWKRVSQKDWEFSQQKEQQIRDIMKAIERLSRTRTGALIVFSTNPNLQSFSNSGVMLNASISAPLLESIFNKDSPLHDGAVIISDGKLVAASCVLPLSDTIEVPGSSGMRHRAGVSVTEGTQALSIIVSEETGQISVAKGGKLKRYLSTEAIEQFLREAFAEFYEEK